MSETVIAWGGAEKIGPGYLVLVVGPSGAGKDTLLGLARAAFQDDDRIVFARRVVTREASSFERNEHISRNEFVAALARNAFIVAWKAHGHSYALRLALNAEIISGRTVVANVSRTVVAQLREMYENVLVVEVTAPADILAARLAHRARSSDGDLQLRLQQADNQTCFAPNITLHNVGEAEDCANKLCLAIRSVSST